MTVIIFTSPIPSHPSIEIISRVVESIRKQLPDVSIWILADGVRPEVEHRRKQYTEYLVYLIERAAFWKNIQVFVSNEHRQQAGLLKWMLGNIHTPLIYINEHDAVLDDKPIDWDAIEVHLNTDANTVRLYWHETIHPEHTFLFGERVGDFVKTQQFSGWPFVMRTDYMKHLLDTYFAENDCQMIETPLYSVILQLPWEEHRTWVYVPQPDAVRFHHLDARRDPITGEKDPGGW